MKSFDLIRLHQELYNNKPSLFLYTPGRVNLIGEHIDYNGGKVMPFAITKGTYVLASKRKDNLFNCYSYNFSDLGVINFKLEDYQKGSNWVDFVKGAIFELSKNNINLNHGLDLTFFGTIPTSSGLSSSASLEVSIFNVLKDIYSLELDDEKIALLSQAIEHDYIGVNCGIMDQYIISCAKDYSVMLLDCSNLEHSYSPFNLGEYTILIMNSCKKRDLASSKYNERLNECKKALEIIRNYYNVSNLCELNYEDLEKIKDKFSDLTIYNRALHCAKEAKRVNDCYIALKNNEITKVGNLLDQSHESLRDLYEVSCAELDTLVESAKMVSNCIGARMTGAGFGGCAIAIVNKNDVSEAICFIKKRYLEIIGYNCEVYVANVAGNTKKLDLENDYEL